jgi:CMP-N-acetylneuraminic acid synthetase
VKTICFIGARGGSKGVLRKNIRKIARKPLIAYTIESALKSKIFSNVVVSTDDKEIASISKKYGAEVPFLRPKKLAGDKIGFAPVMRHGIRTLYSLGYDFDFIAQRDCTAPFIRIKDMRGAVELLKRKKPNAVFCLYKQHFNPYFNILEEDNNGYLKLSKGNEARPRSRQEAPPVYQMTGFKVYDVKKFLKYNSIIMPRILRYEIPPETGLMIDTEFEFKLAELLITNNMIQS